MNTKVTTLDNVNDILEQVPARETFIPMRDRSGSRVVTICASQFWRFRRIWPTDSFPSLGSENRVGRYGSLWRCEGNGLYQRMRLAFPLAFRIGEDITRKDHRNLCKSLQFYTAKVINGALLEAQAKGIVAIPDVDAIICPKRHKETVCALIGKKVHEISRGVFAKVGGIRFRLSPSPMGSITQPPQRSEVCSLQGSNGAPTVHYENL